MHQDAELSISEGLTMHANSIQQDTGRAYILMDLNLASA